LIYLKVKHKIALFPKANKGAFTRVWLLALSMLSGTYGLFLNSY